MNEDKKIYNVLFPIWLLFIFPPIIFFVIAGNYIVDSIVLLLIMHFFKLEKKTYLKTIFKVWGFGFLADIIGAALLLATQFFPESLNKITTAVAWNPFTNIWGLMVVIFAILVSGFFIYIFNYKISFKKLDVDIKEKKKMAMIFAIATMPYLFLLPTALLYK